ncbi:hypothetical protein MNBD_GAMMA05-861 [hydrothermal vent metagenome]|uniref:Thioredoxin domain-containing protein n=1 Tax=hydrothermal vent metagenome TaxID=652676 RepID=A0A3B0WLC5_9ZZZZ
MIKPLLFHLLTLLLLTTFSLHAVEYDEDDLPFVQISSLRNFSALSEEAANSNKIIMLEVSASYCDYCRILEEEIIKPMLRSGDYTKDVLIRQLEIDSAYLVNDVTGEKITSSEFAEKFKIKITPTLLFLDSGGNEVSERILGVYSLDFYGSYVDKALINGLKVIKN